MKTSDIFAKTDENCGCEANNEPKMELDHEVSMAKADLYRAANTAIELHKLLKNVSEQQGLEGWVQAKITKAADYLQSVHNYLDYEMRFEEVEIDEAKKPYVSGGENGKWEVLNAAGKVAKTFTRKEGGIKAANKYLETNYDELLNVKEGVVEGPVGKAVGGTVGALAGLATSAVGGGFPHKTMAKGAKIGAKVGDKLTNMLNPVKNKKKDKNVKEGFMPKEMEGETEFEFTGDDGEMGFGTLYYKAQIKQSDEHGYYAEIDPNSLKGEAEGDGNNKLDNKLATAVVQPGGPDHEAAMYAAFDDAMDIIKNSDNKYSQGESASAGATASGAIATSMGSGNGFKNGGPGTIIRRKKK